MHFQINYCVSVFNLKKKQLNNLLHFTRRLIIKYMSDLSKIIFTNLIIALLLYFVFLLKIHLMQDNFNCKSDFLIRNNKYCKTNTYRFMLIGCRDLPRLSVNL